MGANKRWKRKAKKIWGYCFQNGYKFYYCNDCPKSDECLSIFGWGGSAKPIMIAYKHVKENNIKKAHPKKISKHFNNNL